MPQEHHTFQDGEIVDNNTVSCVVDGRGVKIDVLDGGLPANTYRVTVRRNSTSDGSIVIGAFVRGRDMPLTVVGKLKEEETQVVGKV